MPHQCVKCGTLYEDASNELLAGCTCGSKVFFFLKKEKLQKLKQKEEIKLTREDRERIERDIHDLVGEKLKKDDIVILDFEAINIEGPGKYELDLVQLFGKNPVIYKLEEGKFMIDIPQTFKNIKDDPHKKRDNKAN